jgi:hypothetical protein
VDQAPPHGACWRGLNSDLIDCDIGDQDGHDGLQFIPLMDIEIP